MVKKLKAIVIKSLPRQNDGSKFYFEIFKQFTNDKTNEIIEDLRFSNRLYEQNSYY